MGMVGLGGACGDKERKGGEGYRRWVTWVCMEVGMRDGYGCMGMDGRGE